MSTLKVDTITDSSSGLTTTINGFTPKTDNMAGRNLIINGAMQVAQRGTSTSITHPASGTHFSPDRFEVGITATDQLAATLSQSTTAPDGFSNSLKFEVTTAETTLDANELVTIRQKIEGQDLQRIAKGTSSAEQVTASFWVRSSNTGTYILELYDLDNTRQVSKSYTINSANTWEYKTITFPADTTGAFDNDNNLSLFFMFWLAAGSDFTSGTLNTSWASETTANRVVGQANLIASTNDFYITGVQCEVGDTATPFEHRSYGEELQLCQRYYEQGTFSQRQSGSIIRIGQSYHTKKRANATVNVYYDNNKAAAGTINVSNTTNSGWAEGGGLNFWNMEKSVGGNPDSVDYNCFWTAESEL